MILAAVACAAAVTLVSAPGAAGPVTCQASSAAVQIVVDDAGVSHFSTLIAPTKTGC